MKVLVIGAQGQLGQDLMRVVDGAAVGLTHQDLDVTDGVAVLQAAQAHKPVWVINTTAFHRVDDCEANPHLALAVNAYGAFNVARAAASVGARSLFFSTDYVFGGEPRGRRNPHTEADAPKPLNVYGISKVAGEQLVMHGDPRALVIRSSGLYGTATSRKGWTFPELMLRLASAQEVVRVVDDQVLSPTFTTDLAAAVRRLMNDDASGLFHVVNDGECSWYEFAKATFELTKTQVRLEPQSTAAANRRAPRPPYSALASTRLNAPLRPWSEALADYLSQKGMR
ncbi:MAG: dTDP-4-dehydrorhamnose reductase [Acidobacteria bacterium RIFCSPLOWO2_02_FULL_65_29]|nr:MAG: dTDP-4-dehydrorhamnose reductase [Acidobacteria bacterium RIFCSPLOWO2_02_FULL_65_29]